MSLLKSLNGSSETNNAFLIRNKQLEDDTTGLILKAREADCKPDEESLRGCSRAVRQLFQLWDQLVVVNGVLYRRFESFKGKKQDHLQLVVPTEMREQILRELHEGVASGHLGQDKTLHRLKERFYWPGHFNDVCDWCQTCATVQPGSHLLTH